MSQASWVEVKFWNVLLNKNCSVSNVINDGCCFSVVFFKHSKGRLSCCGQAGHVMERCVSDKMQFLRWKRLVSPDSQRFEMLLVLNKSWGRFFKCFIKHKLLTLGYNSNKIGSLKFHLCSYLTKKVSSPFPISSYLTK